jgi:hypothetical protein
MNLAAIGMYINNYFVVLYCIIMTGFPPLFHNVQTSYEIHAASFIMDTRGFCPGGNATWA